MVDADRLLTIFFLWSYKIATLIVGYLFARLGADLLEKGVGGKFKFSTKFKHINADFISASPGLFFILMGAVIISIGLYKGMTIRDIPVIAQTYQSQPSLEERDKPPLRKSPPTEENHYDEVTNAKK